jgi:hypothetical protein
VRQGREQVKDVRLLTLLHLGAVSPAERSPTAVLVRCLAQLEQLLAGGYFREPDVIEVAGCEVSFRHSPWGPPHGADSQALTRETRASQPDDTDRHSFLLPKREFKAATRRTERAGYAAAGGEPASLP